MDETTEWRVTGDDSGHHYLIREDQSEQFDSWMEWIENYEEGEYAGPDFNNNRFNGPIQFSLPANLSLVGSGHDNSFAFAVKA